MEKLRSIDELRDLFLKVVNRFNEMEKIPYYTGTDMLLHFSEVHLVESIGKNEDINVTRLAKLQGVTKGAISQMIGRLVKKGLVLKNVSPETENEVVLRLTEKGRAVFEQHQQYHERLNRQLTELLSEFPAEMISYLGQLSIGMDKVLNDIIDERTASLKKIGLK
jgi:DNA-binding MarR family transcriptional regulator